MSKNYTVWGPNTSGTGPATMVGLLSGASAKPRVFDLMVGSGATPADQAYVLALSRFTAAGTSTAYTPLPTDANDVAAITVGGITHTIEPTVASTAHLFQFGVNQRASFRYVASPGAEFVATTGAATGLAFRFISATAALVVIGTVVFFE